MPVWTRVLPGQRDVDGIAQRWSCCGTVSGVMGSARTRGISGKNDPDRTDPVHGLVASARKIHGNAPERVGCWVPLRCVAVSTLTNLAKIWSALRRKRCDECRRPA